MMEIKTDRYEIVIDHEGQTIKFYRRIIFMGEVVRQKGAASFVLRRKDFLKPQWEGLIEWLKVLA